MKKIYYLLALVAVIASFSACRPLDKTYDQLGDVPKPTAPVPDPIAVTITLTAADYGTLPSGNPAKTALGFTTKDAAATGIPTILTSKYPTASDKSSAVVTYGITNPSVKLVDSLYSDIAYTPTAADYGGTYLDFSTAQAITFLKKKYPTPSENQMVVLNYTYYESGVTPSAGIPNTIHSYLYMGGVWNKIYTISPAQYTSVGRGSYNEFVAADASNLPSLFNTLLKSDAQVQATAKLGTIIYVSYNYYASSKDYQRVLPLTYDGVNWVTTPTPATLTFVKTSGTWVADNTVYYTMVQADYTTISKGNVGSDAAKSNVASYPDFNTSSSTDATYWSDSDITNAIIQVLQAKYATTAVANQKFVITYTAYNFGALSNKTKTYQYNGTAFVFVQ